MLTLKGNYDSGRSFSLVGTNLKVNLVPSKTYSLGPVLNYRMERDDVDNDRVDAMKDIDAAVEAGVFGGIDINSWMLGAELLADVSDEHDGLLAKISVGYRWQAAPDLVITPRVFTTYADDDYMDTYFGVNSGNRGTSGLPYFEADAGLKDAGFTLGIDYNPWIQWGITGFITYSALLNDAKDSPLVDDEGDDKQMSLGVMATYRWGSK
jgi:outer membrane scaffolding protein for murein synthesis (MipA/OmpV family)